MLKIQLKDKRQEPVWVVEKVFTIGSASDNNLVVMDPSVSDHHARLVNEHDRFFLQDTGSTHGTFVNGRRINKRQVGCHDTIQCGDVQIDILDPLADGNSAGSSYWALVADGSWLAGQEFPLAPGSGNRVVIGRGNECDIVFPGTHLSREHACVTLADDHVTLTDMNSANGTYLNDTRVTSDCIARAGDRVRLDIYSFTLLGPGMQLPQSNMRPTPAEASHTADADDQPGLPKQWKTRPTSPGNRETDHASPSNSMLIALSLLLVVALLLLAAYLLLS